MITLQKLAATLVAGGSLTAALEAQWPTPAPEPIAMPAFEVWAWEAEGLLMAVAPRPEPRGAQWPAVQGSTPPDSLFRAARTALNNGSHEEAVRLLRQLRSQYPRSEYVGDSYYWEAFALLRIGGGDNLRQARELLRVQERQHARAGTRRDAPQLQAQINGQLARMGDAEAAQAVANAAEAVAPSPPRPGAPVTPQPAPRPQGGEDDDVREAALNALMYMDAERATPILRQVLARRDPESVKLRRRAVWVVARQKNADREEILLASAANDPDKEVREQAVYWLSSVKTDRAVMALDSILRMSPDNDIRERAVYALARQDDPRAQQSLRTFAQQVNQPVSVRAQAIFWLARKPENRPFLRQIFGRLENDELREKVVSSLGRSDDSADRDFLMQIALDGNASTDLRKQALFWVGRRDDVSLADLGRLYDQMPEVEIRKQLIYVFSRRDEPEAVDKLMNIAETDPVPELRTQAVYWLGRSKDPRVPEFLMKLINP